MAESLTGGLVAARLVDVQDQRLHQGRRGHYASELKYELLDVPEGPVVSHQAAAAMAAGVRRLMKADVGLGVTGVAGPDTQEGQPPGPCSSAWRRGMPSRSPCASACPATATGCGSSPASRCSTCCAGRWPRRAARTHPGLKIFFFSLSIFLFYYLPLPSPKFPLNKLTPPSWLHAHRLFTMTI